jgi:hypothetical protein
LSTLYFSRIFIGHRYDKREEGKTNCRKKTFRIKGQHYFIVEERKKERKKETNKQTNKQTKTEIKKEKGQEERTTGDIFYLYSPTGSLGTRSHLND